ncbi:hypothetical protein A3C60_00530 [Candidatus Nomurabacteria bacterium RIFCSPHIGHO2_02_FULL_37_45]|uniref:Uncharacterized protein n=2 Tax=Candidatus Nomuraibacteriota TaxID=1752729 RepID=A0A1F6Y540_9BACT|nr:MAG: hypothetical protein A2727_01570 [Candidatus Nomurabacteria bacterium RIFCSPHIGHO2_01_FULL_37_110]OGI70821.1 MAG: hypothetical protein A3C60_00530 [Candidatus Nomurabacteria bacterium RIFCSPHIGHO2_02_FULL_37_45]OGI79047.1 MAG: hypothetical protein A3F19_03295 [Candidatus Nomurabacteria bacterium RIFCSPHIGHO2_12_FULL_37_29]OGI84326.1 MAG: hypothetical protein A3A92_01175 [Candidatus Nomurabacteria bacterium RIFCSPLOWO2_01_FULL_37_49]OGJ01445.1 MAG: hypothetical protein A3G98_00840 [Candi
MGKDSKFLKTQLITLENKFMPFHMDSIEQDPHYKEYTEGGAASVNEKPRRAPFEDQESDGALAWLRGYDDTRNRKKTIPRGGNLKT